MLYDYYQCGLMKPPEIVFSQSIRPQLRLEWRDSFLLENIKSENLEVHQFQENKLQFISIENWRVLKLLSWMNN
jgi:hypothetical protein